MGVMTIPSSISDPPSFLCELDLAVFLNVDPDPAAFINADPDPAAFSMRMGIQLKKDLSKIIL